MLKTVHRYKIFAEPGIEELEKKVNFFLNSGWVLVGGVVVTQRMEYVQAMSYTTEEEIPTVK